MVTTRFLICLCVVVGLARGEDTDGFFLLVGSYGNIVYRFEHGSFSSINVSMGITTMAFEPLSRRVYYGYVFSISLYSMELDGTDVRIEATTDCYVQAIAIDGIAGYIFVSVPGETFEGKMYQIRMGLEPTFDQNNIIHSGERSVYDLAVDPKNRTLFWGSNSGVWQSSYDGTNKRNLLAESGYNHGITVDDDYVYVIKDDNVFKISRTQDLTLTEIRSFGRSYSNLILVGNSLYSGNIDCVYDPAIVCKSSIATVLTDGTGYRKISPEVPSETYSVKIVFVPHVDTTTTTTTTTVESTTSAATETTVKVLSKWSLSQTATVFLGVVLLQR